MNNKSSGVIICLVPIKDEEWILDKFLKAASLWADRIIVADQGSKDKSRDIAARFEKVILIRNNSDNYNEFERQKLLIDESRKLEGDRHILIALDADEFLTTDKNFEKEIKEIKKLNMGTVIKFEWDNIKLKDGTYWVAPDKMPFGFVDDGTKHKGLKIHSPRIPIPENAPFYYPKHIKVMHYQYADWERMKSKHRWYQCWEKINNPNKNSVDIYRQYHHMYSVRKSQLNSIPDEWFYHYDKRGINLKKISSNRRYYWDFLVLDLFKVYGEEYFRSLSIWDYDWSNLKRNFKQRDPRTILDKIVQSYLSKTQQTYNENKLVGFIDKIIKIVYR